MITQQSLCRRDRTESQEKGTQKLPFFHGESRALTSEVNNGFLLHFIPAFQHGYQKWSAIILIVRELVFGSNIVTLVSYCNWNWWLRPCVVATYLIVRLKSTVRTTTLILPPFIVVLCISNSSRFQAKDFANFCKSYSIWKFLFV